MLKEEIQSLKEEYMVKGTFPSVKLEALAKNHRAIQAALAQDRSHKFASVCTRSLKESSGYYPIKLPSSSRTLGPSLVPPDTAFRHPGISNTGSYSLP